LRHSLKQRLIFSFLLLSLLPLGLLGIVVGYLFSSARAAEVQQQLQGTAAVLRRQLEMEIQSWVGEIEELAVSQNVRSLDPRGAKDVLLYKKSVTPVQEALTLVGEDGSIIAATDRNDGASLAGREEVERALKGETVIKETTVDGTTFLTIAVPVNPDGVKIKGVLLGDFALKTLEDVLKGAHTDIFSVYLLNGQGKLLISGQEEADTSFQTLAAREIAAGRGGTGRYRDYKGQEVFGAFLPLQEIGWGVVVERKAAEAMAAAKGISIFLGSALGIIAIFAFLLARSLAGRLMRPLENLVEVSSRVARGELNVEVESRGQDEIGRLGATFALMVGGLKEIVRKISDSAGEVTGVARMLASGAATVQKASGEVRAALAEVAAGAEKQAEGVNVVVEKLNQIAAGMEQIAGRALAIAGEGSRMGDIAAQGARSMNQVTSQMDAIQAQQDNLGQFITSLTGRVEEISHLVGVVGSIAEQTNLLALNAAIEAARAGELGRGFAVVAAEVKKLAEEAGQAARDITRKVQVIQEESGNTVNAMAAARRQVEIGGKVVRQAEIDFTNIRSALGGVLQQVEDISAAIQEISAGSQELKQAVQEIAAISRQTAGLTAGVMAALEHQEEAVRQLHTETSTLEEMSAGLQQAIASFKT
jgi:methyl-accepting chemotaxis protein